MTLWTVAAEPSAWKFGWEALVAIGTLVLAWSTWRLARKTSALAETTAQEVEHSKRQVAASLEQVKIAQQQAATAQDALDASQEQTRLAQLTLNAQIRPVLIDIPPPIDDLEHYHDDILYPGRTKSNVHRHGVEARFDVNSGDAMISVPMRNAGAGLAMIRAVSLEVGESAPTPPVTMQPANVPAGESTRINFLAVPDHPAFQTIEQALERANFSVVVAYSDLAGQQLTLSRFSVDRTAGPSLLGWGVRQVHLQESGADEPFAGSAPTA
jgi:hypothetical protein